MNHWHLSFFFTFFFKGAIIYCLILPHYFFVIIFFSSSHFIFLRFVDNQVFHFLSRGKPRQTDGIFTAPTNRRFLPSFIAAAAAAAVSLWGFSLFPISLKNPSLKAHPVPLLYIPFFTLEFSYLWVLHTNSVFVRLLTVESLRHTQLMAFFFVALGMNRHQNGKASFFPY